MFDGLSSIDWSSMQDAYGPAEEVPALLTAMGSADADERDKALSRFYSVVHHQGDVYRCTAAALPFLFELAGDAGASDRAAIVRLLVSIGDSSVERCDIDYVACRGEHMGYAEAAAVMRERSEAFVEFAADPDPWVRRAAIPGLALFLDDAARAAAQLRMRLSSAPGLMERLLVIETMGTLALRLPAAAEEATAWFGALATDPSADPEVRLAALAQRSRCAPANISPGVVPAAIGLLRHIAQAPTHVAAEGSSPRRRTPPVPAAWPPQVVAAFENMERQNAVYAPTTELLRTLHQALGSRTTERMALLAEQLESPGPGTRLDAIRMACELMKSWRGDHSALIAAVASQLSAGNLEVATEATATLETCHPIAEPTREALAAHLAAIRERHGADAWSAPDPRLRRAYQQAVRALARLGDARVVPSLLAALGGETDAWRAIGVAGNLPQAADQLTPLLCRHLRAVDLTAHPFELTARSLLSALADLGDQRALPAITETLDTAVRLGKWDVTCSALNALNAFGPTAAPALETIRTLTADSDTHVRSAAIAALWAVTADRDTVLPLLLAQLEGTGVWIHPAADLLGQIGPAAAAAVPRLRELLTHSYEWTRVHCAGALWEIVGDTAAPAVLDTLLQAWSENGATANHVAACLDRMGPAARPALPELLSELAQTRRSGRYASIENDEELQCACRGIITRLS